MFVSFTQSPVHLSNHTWSVSEAPCDRTATTGRAQICGSSGRLRFNLAPVAGAHETGSMQINSAACVLTKSTTLDVHLEAILPAHSRFSRSWQLEHVKDETQLPGLIS